MLSNQKIELNELLIKCGKSVVQVAFVLNQMSEGFILVNVKETYIVNEEKTGAVKSSKMNFSQLPAETDKMVSTFSLYMGETGAVILVVFVVFFGAVGLVENLILILSITMTDGFSETPGNVFVLSLAFADLLLSCICPALFIYNMYHSIFNIFMTASRFLVSATTGSMFLLTVNRFLSMVRSLKYPKIMTFKRIVIMIAAIWFVSIIIFIMSLLGMTFNKKPMQHITRYLVIFYVVSSTVMCVYMYNLSRKHRERLRIQRYAVTGQMNATSDEFRALRSLLIVTGSLVACWLPVAIAVFFVDSARNPAQFYRVFSFITSLGIVNTEIDPVVYHYRSKGFRSSLTLLVRRLKNAGCYECC